MLSSMMLAHFIELSELLHTHAVYIGMQEFMNKSLAY